MDYQKILNIAVIAHVDAGKSTLVDAFLRPVFGNITPQNLGFSEL